MTCAPRRSAASRRKATSTTGPSGAPTASASSSGPIGADHSRSGPSRPTAPGRPNWYCAIPTRRSGKACRPPTVKSMIYRTGTIGTADIWLRRLTGDTIRHPLAADAVHRVVRPAVTRRQVARLRVQRDRRLPGLRSSHRRGRRTAADIGRRRCRAGVVARRHALYYRHDDEFMAATLSTKTRPRHRAARDSLQG